jgi:hypothetical protein
VLAWLGYSIFVVGDTVHSDTILDAVIAIMVAAMALVWPAPSGGE